MRVMMAAMLAMTSSVAIADEIDDAHRLAVSGRDSYWNCLAREYPRDSNKNLSEAGFRGADRRRLPIRAAEFPGGAGGLPGACNSRTPMPAPT